MQSSGTSPINISALSSTTMINHSTANPEGTFQEITNQDIVTTTTYQDAKLSTSGFKSSSGISKTWENFHNSNTMRCWIYWTHYVTVEVHTKMRNKSVLCSQCRSVLDWIHRSQRGIAINNFRTTWTRLSQKHLY